MKINKPKFWNSKKFFYLLFFSTKFNCTIIYFFKKKKFYQKLNLNIPIICVGNIYVGGTGKTPYAIFYCKRTFQKWKKTCYCQKIL